MRSFFLVLTLISSSCHGCIAEWRGKSEGTINLSPGMSRNEAQRRSSIPLAQYGSSDYFFEYVLAGESLRFRKMISYAVTWENGRIDRFQAQSSYKQWAEARHDIERAEQLLLQRGWTRSAQGRPGMAGLPDSARDAADEVNYDTSIRRCFYYKGDKLIDLDVNGLTGGLPWYRFANEPNMFWYVIHVYQMNADDLKYYRGY